MKRRQKVPASAKMLIDNLDAKLATAQEKLSKTLTLTVSDGSVHGYNKAIYSEDTCDDN